MEREMAGQENNIYMHLRAIFSIINFNSQDSRLKPYFPSYPKLVAQNSEDHDHVVWLGDTNSRLHWPGHLGGMPLQQAKQKVQQRRFGELLALDQRLGVLF